MEMEALSSRQGTSEWICEHAEHFTRLFNKELWLEKKHSLILLCASLLKENITRAFGKYSTESEKVKLQHSRNNVSATAIVKSSQVHF